MQNSSSDIQIASLDTGIEMTIPQNPGITRVGGVFHLSEPVVGDVPYHFVKPSIGLETLLGEETYNVFTCDVAGKIQDWGGLCHREASFDGPPWLYTLEDLAEPLSFESRASFTVNDKQCFVVSNPWACTDFKHLLTDVIINGECYQVTGVEHRLTMPPYRAGEVIVLRVQ